MAHYIDADRLRAEIERRFWDYGTPLHDDEVTTKVNEVLSIIDSLQQEQTDFPITDEEIERLLATHPKIEVPNKYKTPDWLWKKQEQSDLPSDLEEKSEKPNKFEDELKDYLRRYYNCDYPMQIEENTCSPTMPHIVEAAHHFAQWGAEWQAKQDQETIELAEDHAYLAGSVNEREKMMKDAIHYVVQDDLDSHGASYNIPFIRLGTIALKPKGIGVGDKVCIIIVKEGEK